MTASTTLKLSHAAFRPDLLLLHLIARMHVGSARVSPHAPLALPARHPKAPLTGP